MVGVLKFENKRLRIRCYLLTTAYTTWPAYEPHKKKC